MINSMTGYGEAQAEINGITNVVEIKTVNNRYLKTTIRVPDAVNFLSEDIEKLLRESLGRGTVNYTLKFKNISADFLFDIDESALKKYLDKLKSISDSVDIQSSIDIGNLMNLPGIIQAAVPDEDEIDAIREEVLNISKQAIKQLQQMRAAEGQALAADLKQNCDKIEYELTEIASRSSGLIEEYRAKLEKRVNSLLAGAKLKLDEETLAREVAILADRSDISEEISRLRSHLDQFKQTCDSDQQAGRRLDFISQEMLREANTIASKASDYEIINRVVDIKCRVDRIKEQIQNIE